MPDSFQRGVESSALRAAGVYLVLGSLWIAFSDRAVLSLAQDPELVTRLQTGKGWFFVLASALVVYFLTRRALRHLTHREVIERRVGSILDTIPSRVAWRDGAGRYLGCNARFARDAGLDSPEDIRGKAEWDLSHPLNIEEVEKAVGRVLKGGDAVLDREAITASGDDELTWMRYSVVPLPGNGDEQSGVLLCYEDVSREIRSRQQLRQAQTMNEINRYTSGVAHDFNNVLSVIQTNAELISEGTLDENEARLAVREIGSAAQGASHMVKKLLGLGRRADVEVRPTDVTALLRGFSAMFSRLLTPRYPYRLETRGTPPKALVDPTTVEQALLNLITNARDAMEDGGSIEVEVEEVRLPDATEDAPGGYWAPPSPTPPNPGSYVAVSVTDEGPGIPADGLSSIFQPFFTTKAPGTGTGLGLAMVQGLMEQQGGGVQVRTAPGRGTTMRLLLPLAAEKTAEADCLSPPGSNASDAGPSTFALGDEGAGTLHPQVGDGVILVVDDSDELRRTMARVLRRYGWEVLEASGGEEALQIVETRGATLSLILSDLTMPGMGGLDLYREIRARRISIPFAVTSGLADLRDTAASDEEAAIPFIPKPWTARGLAERVGTLVAVGVPSGDPHPQIDPADGGDS